MTPQVSIIVPLTGGPAQALRCFQGIAAQAADPTHEIIIVDDASVGLEPLLARLDGDVEVLRTERRVGLSAALGHGLERATGDFVVLLREAAAPAPGWLSALAGPLDQDAGLVASVTAGDPAPNPLGAWAVAVRAEELRSIGLPDVPDHLLFGALALELSQRGRRVLSAPKSIVSAPGQRTGGARRAPGEEPELTIVIPTLDAASDRIRACIAAVQARTDAAHEIVIVDNGAPPQGFSAPVNAGLRAARTPYLVVINDDVEPLPGWWAPLRAALDAGASVVFPLTVGGAMRHDFAAWCLAMQRAVMEEFSHAPGEFFDPALALWYQDTDLLHRLRAAGRPPALVEASHIHHGLSATLMSEDPELSAWIRTQVAADRERFLRKHPDAILHGHALAPS